jgi:hypothetical protein
MRTQFRSLALAALVSCGLVRSAAPVHAAASLDGVHVINRGGALIQNVQVAPLVSFPAPVGGAKPDSALAAPMVTYAPMHMEFPALKIGAALEEELNIRNMGRATLAYSASITGDSPQDFVVTSISSGTIPPQGRTMMVVRLRPTACGTRRATLLINYNAPDSPAHISLVGNGYGLPAIEIIPGSLDFGRQPVFSAQKFVFTSGSTKTVAIKNVSAEPLTIGITCDGDRGVFCVAGNRRTLTIPANGFFAFSINFDPKECRSYNAILSIGWNSVDSSFTIPLTGRGVPPKNINSGATSGNRG